MRVILKPISHPQMGEISIAGDLFAIGRNEEPFASGLGAAAVRLSRRHARIFQENGKAFVADLGSTNGTQLNERPLKDRVAPLQNNDLLTFGDEIRFRVEIKRQEAGTLPRLPPLRLTLEPADMTSGLECIAIEQFPFLIARVESAFEQYADRFPDALRKLSRRHAVLALKGGKVHVEDLASVNGTYVGGQRLDERARPLADGDTIMFGSPQFTYTVRIATEQEALLSAKTMMAAPAADGTVAAMPVDPSVADPSVVSQSAHRTRFVSSADSFINVFCAESAQGGGAAAKKEEGPDTAKTPVVKGPVGPWQRTRALFGEMWRALHGPSRANRKVGWAAAAVVLFVAAAIGGSYLVGADRREIKSLLDDGHYAESARVANKYLAEQPNDQEAAAWGEEALAKAVVPTWLQHIEHGRYDDAARYLSTQTKAYASIPRSKQMLDTLAWAGRVQAHMADRGPSGRVVLFKHEQPIKTLVAEWDSDSAGRQQIMDQILNRVPEFEPVHSRVFSGLRTLRSDEALYVKAMEQLDADVTRALRKDDRRAVDKLIGDFSADYSQIGGVDALKEDLSRFDKLAALANQKDLLELVRISRTTTFQTPTVARYAEDWLTRSLPPQEVVAKYAEASQAWRAGKHDEAIAILEPLAKNPSADSWGDVATRQISRYRKVEGEYEDLMASRQSPGYWDKLLLFWSSLRPNEDEHLMRALEPDFVAHREKLMPALDESMRRAQRYWNDYRTAGGIPGVVRVEDRVSERFAGQAKRLSGAFEEVTSGARTYQLLQTPPSQEWQSLQEEVVNEVARQRRWLEDLDIVMEPSLLRAKLALLPKEQEQSLWVQSTTAHDQD